MTWIEYSPFPGKPPDMVDEGRNFLIVPRPGGFYALYDLRHDAGKATLEGSLEECQRAAETA